MRVLLVGSLAAVAASAALQTQTNGILPGEAIAVVVSSPDGLFAGSAQLQTSPDNVTWTNVGAAMTANGAKVNAIVADRFIRLNCTARTAGTIEATIIATTG
jgi:hypothetical protein